MSCRGSAEVFYVFTCRMQSSFHLEVEGIVGHLRATIVEFGKQFGIPRYPGQSSNLWRYPHSLAS